MSRRILLTGGSGQLGRALRRTPWPADIALVAPSRAELDLTDPPALRAAVADGGFSAVINVGAYTAVDRAESDADAAFAVNARAPATLAQAAAKAGVPMVHLSTDHVFDGEAGRPYREDDATAPPNVYGASKLEGEQAILASGAAASVIRTTWVFSPDSACFLTTVLRLARDRPVIEVVEDQFGSPTAAADLAQAVRAATLALMDRSARGGLYHFAGEGGASRAALAEEILARSAEAGGPAARVRPVTSDAFPAAARRPRDARLATTRFTRDHGVAARPWRDAVAEAVRAALSSGRGT